MINIIMGLFIFIFLFDCIARTGFLENILGLIASALLPIVIIVGVPFFVVYLISKIGEK